MRRKPKAVKSGYVRKIIKPIHPSLPEKAEIEVRDADDLYNIGRDVIIQLRDENGKKVKLKENAEVDVVVEADARSTTPDPKPS